jgi:hypothetical protein
MSSAMALAGKEIKHVIAKSHGTIARSVGRIADVPDALGEITGTSP